MCTLPVFEEYEVSVDAPEFICSDELRSVLRAEALAHTLSIQMTVQCRRTYRWVSEGRNPVMGRLAGGGFFS